MLAYFANLSFNVSPQFKRYAESVENVYEAALNAALVSKLKFLFMHLSVCFCRVSWNLRHWQTLHSIDRILLIASLDLGQNFPHFLVQWLSEWGDHLKKINDPKKFLDNLKNKDYPNMEKTQKRKATSKTKTSQKLGWHNISTVLFVLFASFSLRCAPSSFGSVVFIFILSNSALCAVAILRSTMHFNCWFSLMSTF